MMAAIVIKVMGVQMKVPGPEQAGNTFVRIRHTTAVFYMNSRSLGNSTF